VRSHPRSSRAAGATIAPRTTISRSGPSSATSTPGSGHPNVAICRARPVIRRWERPATAAAEARSSSAYRDRASAKQRPPERRLALEPSVEQAPSIVGTATPS